MDVTVIYTLTAANELQSRLRCRHRQAHRGENLTNHTKFNLTGDGMGSVSGQLMMINADYFTPTDATQIPTGELAPVEDLKFDFRKPKVIGTGER